MGEREKGAGDCLHWWVQGSTSSPTGIGCRQRVLDSRSEGNVLFMMQLT